ncbi:ribonuclease H-like domain-containing protein [Trametes polyzona]|nr:ribonuclease H-like domain-containing protein [Trametes polyzona]
MVPKITYCKTPASISNAVAQLSAHTVLLVDCEAKELGMPDGVLSLVALSGPNAKHIFLVDALAFPSPSSDTPPTTPLTPHPALAPLIALLVSPAVTKVFWDGRADALELRMTWGVTMENVLDLQLVDVVARARQPERALEVLATGFLKPLKADIARGSGMLSGCLGLGRRGVPALKDPAIVAMHAAGGSALWLKRPLPENLLEYAAHDLTLIALVYAYFLRKTWIHTAVDRGTLGAQSARYVAFFGTREGMARAAAQDRKRFMPLGIIDDVGDGGRGQGKRGGQTRTGVQVQRRAFCRLCNAIAKRNEEAEGEWVDF